MGLALEFLKASVSVSLQSIVEEPERKSLLEKKD